MPNQRKCACTTHKEYEDHRVTILFDIGNVLLRFDYKEKLRALVPTKTTDVDARLRLLDEKRDVLECGKIEVDDFVQWALGILESDAGPEEFVSAWRSIFTPIIPTWDLAKKLRADGHRLILFSNINAIHCPWIYEEYEIFPLFHGAVMSYQIGCMKPHDDFYQIACRDWQLDPQQTLYIDDLQTNIDAGIKAGFQCHCYDWRNHAALENWLKNVL